MAKSRITGHGLANYLRDTEVPKSQAKKQRQADREEWPILQDFGTFPITEGTHIGLAMVENPKSKIASLSVFKTNGQEGEDRSVWGTRTFAPITPSVVALLYLIGTVLEQGYGMANAQNEMGELGKQVLAVAKKQ